MVIVAHRGLHDQHVENMLPALHAAWDAGLTYCEIDIRGSLEHEPFLMHDATLERTFSAKGAIDQMHAAAMRKIGVPSFDELLKSMPKFGRLFVEIKPGVTREVIRRTMEACDPATCMVQSFDVRVLADAKEIRRDIQLVELADDVAKLRFIVGGVNVMHKSLSRAVVADLRARGLWVGAWTPNEPADIERMLSLNLDAITSDKPLLVREMHATFSPKSGN